MCLYLLEVLLGADTYYLLLFVCFVCGSVTDTYWMLLAIYKILLT